MDITQFHQLMKDKYQERETRHLHLLRIWILYIAAPVAFSLSFALAYLLTAGK